MESPPLPLDRIGQRFSIRLHEPDGGYRDVVGFLNSSNSVINRHGTEIIFDPNQIFIWREILERKATAGKGAPLTLRVFELDQICNATWPAPEQLEENDWLLRAAGGITNRANSIQPLAAALKSDKPNDFANKLESVQKFYRARNLPTIFQLALPTWQGLYEDLTSVGAIETIRGNTMVSDLVPVKVNLPSGFEIIENAQVTEQWSEVHPTPGIETIISGCPATYLYISNGAKAVACVRIALWQSWSSITRVYVKREFRGTGLGKAIVSAALNKSLSQGATKAVLQVEATNAVAIGIYESLGFTFHHEYVYLELR